MGRAVTLTARVRDTAGHTVTATTTLTVADRLLVGMDAPNGTEFQNAVAQYPNLKYTRDFGKDGTDADTLPELTPHGTGKLTTLPAGCIPHLSCKDDNGTVATWTAWLNGLTYPCYLSPYHEPEGDITPAEHAAMGGRITQALSGHPNAKFVLGHGPILTRYNLDEEGINPADWGYTGMTHFGVDCYQDQPTAAAYWAPSKMFGVAFGKIRAAYPGIRLWVPEMGITKLTTDTTGAGRAQAIRDHIGWLRTQPDVDAVAYFNNMAQFPKYAFTATSLEGQAWRDMQAA